MPSTKESFFTLNSFAFVGNTKLKPFPKLSYGNLKKKGKTVFPIDLAGSDTIEGDKAYSSYGDLPQPVEGVVVEVPKDTVLEVVKNIADEDFEQLWFHMGCDTPEAVKLAEEKGKKVHTGGCAVMYTQEGFSYHSLHKFFVKLFGKY